MKYTPQEKSLFAVKTPESTLLTKIVFLRPKNEFLVSTNISKKLKSFFNFFFVQGQFVCMKMINVSKKKLTDAKVSLGLAEKIRLVVLAETKTFKCMPKYEHTQNFNLTLIDQL